MEKKASDLTKRFVSYSELLQHLHKLELWKSLIMVSKGVFLLMTGLVFHEVRVPLNTALLSVQNLEGENLFDCFTDDQREMVHGLTNSLAMMEKVSC